MQNSNAFCTPHVSCFLLNINWLHDSSIQPLTILLFLHSALLGYWGLSGLGVLHTLHKFFKETIQNMLNRNNNDFRQVE